MSTYTTKELAKKLNKSANDIYRIKQKYSHLLLPEHCIKSKVSGCNILLWDESVVKQMDYLFLLESKKAKDHISNWKTKKELAMILNIKPAKLDQYFNEIVERLLIGTDYGYWQQNGAVTQRWSETGIAKLCEYIEYLHGYSYQAKDSKPIFGQTDFDKAISDLESQISELKANYPEFANIKSISNCNKFRGVYSNTSGRYGARYGGTKNRVHIGVYSTPEEAARAYDLELVKTFGEGCTTNFFVEGVKTTVLYPQFSSTKPKQLQIVRQQQLDLIPIADNKDADETVFDRMRAFALENGIEIKTMKTS